MDAVPGAITLRTGLAVSLAVEDFAPALKDRVRLKWPNDLMLIGAGAAVAAKTAGILTESVSDASCCTVYIGVGVNLAQTEFPEAFSRKATSLLLAQQSLSAALPHTSGFIVPSYNSEDRFLLLEKILAHLYAELNETQSDWRERLLKRLYRYGERVRFFAGGVDSRQQVDGVLSGISETGELIITADGETEGKAFITGELDVYGA
jgi:BirA family biotin operon repressor/biotin-[acetyl-CoA-carboxylase] ligase